jgi:hypothetical protein
MKYSLPLVVAILLSFVVVLVLFPKLLTGDYYSLTVKSIYVNRLGNVLELELEETISDGTRAVQRFTDQARGDAFEGKRGFPAWPVHQTTFRSFIFSEPYRLDLDDPAKGVYIEEGRTYTVRRGEPLTLFYVVDDSGQKREYIAEISP